MRKVVLLLKRLGGFGVEEALTLSFDEAQAWLECAVEVEREMAPQ